VSSKQASQWRGEISGDDKELVVEVALEAAVTRESTIRRPRRRIDTRGGAEAIAGRNRRSRGVVVFVFCCTFSTGSRDPADEHRGGGHHHQPFPSPPADKLRTVPGSGAGAGWRHRVLGQGRVAGAATGAGSGAGAGMGGA
jgi:hypothetical protein